MVMKLYDQDILMQKAVRVCAPSGCTSCFFFLKPIGGQALNQVPVMPQLFRAAASKQHHCACDRYLTQEKTMRSM
jgi:hypothetical protein